ncbi:hypothetical protein [Sulfolobus acidocaldarius]|uniref:hypothetical protein n=1 Tax=Sulfolobus acidocaldarius TaxID=2285 RepID=UPI000AC20350|nr:hypothetical protein [Sulfolobus acidocaldarius]
MSALMRLRNYYYYLFVVVGIILIVFFIAFRSRPGFFLIAPTMLGAGIGLSLIHI